MVEPATDRLDTPPQPAQSPPPEAAITPDGDAPLAATPDLALMSTHPRTPGWFWRAIGYHQQVTTYQAEHAPRFSSYAHNA